MIVDKSEMPKKVMIDLTGPEGNAFCLLSYADDFAKQLDYSKEEKNALIADMTSGEYEHLVSVFDKHFGSFVTLYR